MIRAWPVSQNITVGSASGNRGSSIDLPVSFNAGSTSVSSMQFDLSIPSGLSYTSISTGSAASSAGKSAAANLNGTTLRVFISGLNQNTIGTGQLASIRLAISSTASLGSLSVNISGITASNPSGSSVSVTGTNGAVTVQ